MLRAAIIFFILALISLIFGFVGFAGVSMEIGRTLLVIFLILSVLSFIMNWLTGGRGPRALP